MSLITASLDPQTLQDLLTGISANALWSLIAHSGGKAFATLRQQIGLKSSNMFTAAAAAVAAEFAETGKERSQLRAFLASPDVESIVRQIYAMKSIERQQIDLETIQKEFILAFARHLDVNVERAQSAAEAIFHALVSECDAHFSAAVDANLLAAHESRSTARYRRLIGELQAIKRTVDLLATATQLQVEDILRFEENYRAQVADRHSHIQPPHLETARKFPIDNLYVTPTLLSARLGKQRDPRRFALDEFLNRSHRTVVLGNPGGGKSTLALKLCHDLATRYDERLLNHRLLTPILVILREYGGLKKTNHCSILRFIENQSESRYQLTPSPRSFEYLLLSGRVLVIFDGLDELLDTSYRREISSDVESFCHLYPSVPVVVTSREVGYEQAPLDRRQFQIFKIAPFDENQVKDYARKWFSLDDELSPDESRNKADAFIRETALALDLRSNPLMLGLMCNLYRAEGYIPRNRPEIYEKCSLMLFERWDKGRGIMVALPFEVHIRPAMRHLAYWIYSQEALQGGVERTKLVAETSKYLLQRVFDDQAEADAAAENFVEFCTGRAWVFTDTGTTPDGEKLYQFTHRTFLEYFSAIYLFSIHPTPSLLLPVLIPHIAKQEWDVVAQLAFQIQSRSLEGAADEALEGLLHHAVQLSREERWSVLLFALRSLDSIVPSPAVRRAAVTVALRDIISTSPVGGGRHDGGFALIGALHAVSRDNRATVADTVEKVLSEIISAEGTSPREGTSAFEIAYELPSPQMFNLDVPAISTDWKYWSTVSSSILDSHRVQLERFARQELVLAASAYHRGHISISELLQWHGIKAVFDVPHSRTFSSWWPPLWSQLFIRLLSSKTNDAETIENDLAVLGGFLLQTPPPWLPRRAQPHHQPDYRIFTGDILRSLDASETGKDDPTSSRAPNAEFALFAFTAIILESAEDAHRKELVSKIATGEIRFLSNSIRPALVGRFQQPLGPWECDLSGRFKEVVDAWVRHEISFVRQTGNTAETSEGEPSQLDLDVISGEEIDSVSGETKVPENEA